MSTEAEVQEVLLDLSVCCITRNVDDIGRMIDLYTRRLQEFSPAALKRAAQRYIESNKFFPSLAELIELAKVAEESLKQAPDELRERANFLEGCFYREGVIDPDAWEKLALAFEAAGREFGAEGLRSKMARLQVCG